MRDIMTINLILAVVALVVFVAGGIAGYIEEHKQAPAEKDNSPTPEEKTSESCQSLEDVMLVKPADKKTARHIRSA